MNKRAGEAVHRALAITVVFAIGLILLISIKPGKCLRREFAQEKISLTSESSGSIEKITRELTNTTAENRTLLFEQKKVLGEIKRRLEHETLSLEKELRDFLPKSQHKLVRDLPKTLLREISRYT